MVATEAEAASSTPSALEATAPTPMGTARTTGAGALVTSAPSSLLVGAPASPLPQDGVAAPAQGGGDGSSLLALTQGFTRRELDWGRLRGAAASVATLMRTLLGPALVVSSPMPDLGFRFWAYDFVSDPWCL